MIERDEQISQDYMDGRTTPSLADEYGLSQTRIWQILNLKGVSGSIDRKQVPKAIRRTKPISDVHETLGRRLSEFELDRRIDARELSRRLNWSKNTLTATEKGCKDPTLTELMEVSRLFKIPVGAMLSECGA